jgi:hypothetical protein
MVLDGVADSEDYYQGGSLIDLIDADAAFDTFFTSCLESGPSLCEFWDSSVPRMRAHFNAVLGKLASSPYSLPKRTLDKIAPFRMSLFHAAKSPFARFSSLARALPKLEQSSAQGLAHTLDNIEILVDRKWGVDFDSSFEPRWLIICTDANSRSNLTTFQSFRSYANLPHDTSLYSGAYVAPFTPALCRDLDIKAPKSQVFTGKLGAN